jgi:hypothetical protein
MAIPLCDTTEPLPLRNEPETPVDAASVVPEVAAVARSPIAQQMAWLLSRGCRFITWRDTEVAMCQVCELACEFCLVASRSRIDPGPTKETTMNRVMQRAARFAAAVLASGTVLGGAAFSPAAAGATPLPAQLSLQPVASQSVPTP